MTMHDMPMPGGWTMSMAWMRMPGETWIDAGVAFVGMWVPMMAAMMAPSVIPALYRYRQALAGRGAARVDRLGACAAVAYLSVWTASGLAVFAAGAAIASAAMAFPDLARAVPTAAGVVVLLAGVLQFTPWKRRRLACCRGALAHDTMLAPSAGAAWRDGTRLGLHCVACCSGLTAILLVVGVMNGGAMVAVTAAITLERLAPAGPAIARIVGAMAIGAGALLVIA